MIRAVSWPRLRLARLARDLSDVTRLVQLIGAVPVRQVFDAAHEQLCRADEQAQAGEGLRDDLEPKAADKPRLDELEAGVEEAERCHDPAVPPGRVRGGTS